MAVETSLTFYLEYFYISMRSCFNLVFLCANIFCSSFSKRCFNKFSFYFLIFSYFFLFAMISSYFCSSASLIFSKFCYSFNSLYLASESFKVTPRLKNCSFFFWFSSFIFCSSSYCCSWSFGTFGKEGNDGILENLRFFRGDLSDPGG